ncbi:MAG: hypothetical protein IKA02_05870 [Clostridia bacterium]|nr:hypothetical protein [Clostridia bacterium]
MENLMTKMVFANYYAATLGRFYTTEQKDKLLKLIAKANNIESDKIDELVQASRYIEQEDIGNEIGCKNFLLYSLFTNDVSSVVKCAVSALNEIFSSKTLITSYSNELLWHRSVQKEKNPLEIGYYEYARGRLDRSIESMEKAIRTEKNMPLIEYIAIIANDSKNFSKAYEYALKAQVISGDERLEIDWLMEIEQEAKANLTASEIEKIERSVFGSSGNAKIGFSQ